MGLFKVKHVEFQESRYKLAKQSLAVSILSGYGTNACMVMDFWLLSQLGENCSAVEQFFSG